MNFRVAASLLLLLAVSTPASAQWAWLNPRPQGHTLYDIEFLDDDTAIAVGEAGTILVTHDAGLSWTTKTKILGLLADLSQVARIDETRAIAVGDAGTILKTHDAGATWAQISSGTGTALEGVDYEAGIALAVGNAVMLRSIDFGDTWSPVALADPYPLRAVDVISATAAVAVGDFIFLRSPNSGTNWVPSFFPTRPTALAFADELHGFVGSNSGYHSTDTGGMFWDLRFGPDLGSHHDTSPTDIELDGIDNLFVSATAGGCDGMLNCFSAGHLFRSVDGGFNWAYSFATRPLHGVARNGAGTVLLVGDAGSIYRWSDPVWTRIGGSPYDSMGLGAGAAFLNPSVGIVAGTDPPVFGTGKSIFLRTSDAGTTWASKSLFGVLITDLAYAGGPTPPIYATGRSGALTVVYKSSDGGATWPVQWTSAATPTLWGIAFQSSSHGIAVGDAGSFVVIDSDVVSPGTIPGAGALFDVCFADASVVLAVGGTGGSQIVRSVNGGSDWGLVTHPAGVPLSSVAFATPLVGVAVGGNGRILRTEDAGATWNPVVSPTTQYLASVSFSTESHGMAVGNSGTVLETIDGGTSWSSLDAPTDVGFHDVICFTPTHAILVAWDLIVLEYHATPLPTLISSFTGEAEQFAVDLSWAVRDEANLSEFGIERQDARGVGRSFGDIAPSARSFRDDTVVPGATYSYVLVAFDADGSETYSAPVRVATSPAQLELLPNVPNPFNPSTTIRYVLPRNENVRVTIYDVSGRPVTTLVDRGQAPGQYSVAWNGTDINGARVASGVYLVRIEAGKQSQSRKMVLLK